VFGRSGSSNDDLERLQKTRLLFCKRTTASQVSTKCERRLIVFGAVTVQPRRLGTIGCLLTDVRVFRDHTA
jgi:hypothetical protein